jgi:hypothetical protein
MRTQKRNTKYTKSKYFNPSKFREIFSARALVTPNKILYKKRFRGFGLIEKKNVKIKMPVEISVGSYDSLLLDRFGGFIAVRKAQEEPSGDREEPRNEHIYEEGYIEGYECFGDEPSEKEPSEKEPSEEEPEEDTIVIEKDNEIYLTQGLNLKGYSPEKCQLGIKFNNFFVFFSKKHRILEYFSKVLECIHNINRKERN